MRDWKLEDVKRKGGTPSRLALKPYIIKNRGDNPSLRWPGICTYFIAVVAKSLQSDHWILCLENNVWSWIKNTSWFNVGWDNPDIDAAHGPQVRVVPLQDEDDISDHDGWDEFL